MGVPAAARRRELSLWPLAMFLLVGGLLIGGAVWGASQFRLGASPEAEQRAEAALLDSMQQDAQAVTPLGLHEIQLRRYTCADGARDEVDRTLRIDGEHQLGAVRTAILDACVKRGWHRITFAFAVSKDTVERKPAGRSLQAVESHNRRTLTIYVADGTCGDLVPHSGH